jgi:hypothetical protein
MKYFQYVFLSFLIFSLFMAFPSCNPDDPCMDETNPDCINYNPCKAEYPEKFEIELMWPNYLKRTQLEKPFVPTEDTAFSLEKTIVYKTNYDYDSIFWKVGADPRVANSLTYTILFQNEDVVTTSAICHRPINTTCFGPNDDGIDTLYKTISLHHRTKSRILGTYRGTNDGETDSITFRIWYDTLQSGRIQPLQTGLPKGFKGEEGVRIERYNFYGSRGDISSDISGDDYWGRLQPDGNTIKVYWRTETFDGTRLVLGPERVYTGTRIR